MPREVRCQLGNSAPLSSLNDNAGRFSRPLLEDDNAPFAPPPDNVRGGGQHD